jgi:lipopolysaccharide/colanic/teichoic acid biosynthesis glycosyltransferase
MDLVLGVFGLVLAAPILAISILAMRLSGDRGPIIYRARRIGENWQPFEALKLRTMRPVAGGSTITVHGDPRITRVGKVLRRFRIDELPQLVNVIKGEMSLVGPRPEDPAYVDISNPLHRRVFSARPGITGLAQLEFHDESRLLVGPGADQRYRDEILPAKLALDASYLDDWSLRGDLAILARTVLAVIGRGGPRGVPVRAVDAPAAAPAPDQPPRSGGSSPG